MILIYPMKNRIICYSKKPQRMAEFYRMRQEPKALKHERKIYEPEPTVPGSL